ncbi:MAG: tRNA1(Val) (adenine(37)-N6)-methyltransferase [Clostridia bacterium]|mgnify:CR=1 FL=1|nr:tRNA1(Val) (adenine(37)-N6)-methyltransferase [Clostridia bacterium]
MVEIKHDESLDDLILSGLKIIQKKSGFRFAIDAVLLAHFTSLENKDKVIDLGTGTGIIPLLLTTRCEDLDITAVEIQGDMVEMAKRSLELNNLDNIRIIQGDFRELESLYNDKFNLVISNPPYLPLNQGKISPREDIALSRHELKCNLREVISTASRLLKMGGRFSLVHRSERLAEIITEFTRKNIEPKRLRLVYPQLEKPSNLVLLEGIKGAKPGLKIEKPLAVYDGQGNYTQEVLKFYGGDFNA